MVARLLAPVRESLKRPPAGVPLARAPPVRRARAPRGLRSPRPTLIRANEAYEKGRGALAAWGPLARRRVGAYELEPVDPLPGSWIGRAVALRGGHTGFHGGAQCARGHARDL